MSLTNRGGASFKLEPGESREIVMQLQRGSDFTADDVDDASERTIRVGPRADGILVGGMSYELDPKLRYPTRFGGKAKPRPGEPGHVHDENCGCDRDDRVDYVAETLMQFLKGRHQRVREVEIRKVIVEIEFDDCDDDD